MIVGVVADCTVREATAHMDAAARWCDRFEIRLDRIVELDPDADWSWLFARAPRPTIATCRSRQEGGAFDGGPEEQRDWLQQAIAAGATAVDWELLAETELVRDPAEVTVIRSVHQLTGTPPTLDALLGLARHAHDVGADVFKVAFPASDIVDCLLVRDLCEAAPLPCVAVALGPYGVPSRIAYRALGSVWTYGTLPGREAVAPGQLGVQELAEVYRAPKLHADTRFYGLLGNPVAHSRGMRLHNAALRVHDDLDACYLPLLTRDIEAFWRFARALPLAGASVTAPFKESVIPGLDALSADATAIGSVNTIHRDGHGGPWVGSNTDYAGAFDTLDARLPGGARWFAGKTCLVVGAGGVARVLVAGLLARGARVLVVNRTPGRAEALVAALRRHAPDLARLAAHPAAPEFLSSKPEFPARVFPTVESAVSGEILDFVANATTLGMEPDADAEPFSWPEAFAAGMTVARDSWAFDAVYTPAPTRWLREADTVGLHTIDGREMFRRQAECQYTLWHKRPLPSEETIESAGNGG